MRRRAYIAPLGLWLTLDAGTLDRIEVITDTGSVRAGLSAANPFTPEALLRMEQPANLAGVGTYRPAQELAHTRGGYRVGFNPWALGHEQLDSQSDGVRRLSHINPIPVGL